MKYGTIGTYIAAATMAAATIIGAEKSATMIKEPAKQDSIYLKEGVRRVPQTLLSPRAIFLDEVIRKDRPDVNTRNKVTNNKYLIQVQKQYEKNPVKVNGKLFARYDVEGEKIVSSTYNVAAAPDSMKVYAAPATVATEAGKAAGAATLDQKVTADPAVVVKLNKENAEKIANAQKTAKKPVQNIANELTAEQFKTSKYAQMRNFYETTIVGTHKMSGSARVTFNPNDGVVWMQEGNQFKKDRFGAADLEEVIKFAKENK